MVKWHVNEHYKSTLELNKKNKKTMKEFWKEVFKDKQEMWGLEPAKSTVFAKEIFLKHNV